MEKIPLIHPIYLDVPMLVSFAAATQGGLSLESEVTAEKGASRSINASASVKLGLPQLFQKLFDASVSAELAGERSAETYELRKELKAHTEASIAILLYHQLQQAGGYILQPKNIDDVQAYGPGTLVEVAGTVEKNAVDAVIDYMDAVAILSRLDLSQSQQQQGKGKNRPKGAKSVLEQMRDTLDSDRKRTPISNIVVRCSEPADLCVVVTLRTENLLRFIEKSSWLFAKTLPDSSHLTWPIFLEEDHSCQSRLRDLKTLHKVVWIYHTIIDNDEVV